MADPGYHHSDRTRFTRDECEAAVGRRAVLVLEGTIVEAREMDAGALVVFQPDERYGFDMSVGGDLELFDLKARS